VHSCVPSGLGLWEKDVHNGNASPPTFGRNPLKPGGNPATESRVAQGEINPEEEKP